MRRALALLAAAALTLVVAVGVAAAEAPTYNGAMQFPPIHGPAEAEEFSWEVQLGEEQTLEGIDDQRAAVRYENGVTAFEISAEAAHDAAGATVPTTLAVTQPNLITLTVHHRAGNPAAGEPRRGPARFNRGNPGRL